MVFISSIRKIQACYLWHLFLTLILQNHFLCWLVGLHLIPFPINSCRLPTPTSKALSAPLNLVPSCGHYIAQRWSLHMRSTTTSLFIQVTSINQILLNPLHCQLNQQSVGYVHSCLELVNLIPMSTNNPSPKSVVLESAAKPSLGCQFGSPGLIWQKIKPNLLGVVGVMVRTKV